MLSLSNTSFSFHVRRVLLFVCAEIAVYVFCSFILLPWFHRTPLIQFIIQPLLHIWFNSLNAVGEFCIYNCLNNYIKCDIFIAYRFYFPFIVLIFNIKLHKESELHWIIWYGVLHLKSGRSANKVQFETGIIFISRSTKVTMNHYN